MATDHLLSRNKAIQQYDAAFHILHVTFPLVRDPKLLMGIIHNMLSSFEHSIDAILSYERQLRLVSHYPDNFESKFNIFRYRCVKRNKIPPKLVHLISQLKYTVEMHKKSPMEFQRGNRFVICNKDYQLQIISIKDIKDYLNQTKEFLDIMENIIKLDRKE